MTGEHFAVEVAQLPHHIHDSADLLAERMAGLPNDEAEALLEKERRPCEAARSKERHSGDRIERVTCPWIFGPIIPGRWLGWGRGDAAA